MPQQAAGLLMYRHNINGVQFFLVHPGGPFYKNKDEGVWSIPKGLVEGTEEMLATAQREFHEETGIKPKPPFTELGMVRSKSGKLIHVWMFRGEWDETTGIVSNTFPLEWPPRSGKIVDFPEADRGAWFFFNEAQKAINQNQVIFLERALSLLPNAE